MTQQIEKILRKSGDDPKNPYCLKVAFTGTAAANILGQTMHSAFSFNFGNSFLSLGDKSRDIKRSLLQNLQIVVVDEYSMIPSDMLYQLDLRLKELKERPNQPFGGMSVILLGDILQLRPVLGRLICEMPKCETYHLSYLTDPLWDKFKSIILVKNHRQGEDGLYASILNRMREEKMTENDIKVLETRVRPLGHSDIPLDATFVSCTNAEVNRINEDMLALIDSPVYVLEAIVKSDTLRIVRTLTERSGAIRNTPLQKVLKIKIGAKVMLTHNIDTCDSLTNGSFGEIVGLEFSKSRKISRILVHFNDENCGKERRKNYKELQSKYPGKNVVPIEMIEFPYCVSKKPTIISRSSTVMQFPLKLAFAATAHNNEEFSTTFPR